MRRDLTLAFVTSALLVLGCEKEAPRAFGEMLFIVDTDWPDSTGIDRLRVDLFEADGRWFATREITDFLERRPLSFSVYSDDDTREKFVWVRLRAYPTGHLRDTPAVGQPRLVVDDVDVTPPAEPAPGLSVDRLAVVRLRPGVRKSLPLTLHGACAGTEAILRKGDASRGPVSLQAAACVDEGGERDVVAESRGVERDEPVAPDPHRWGVDPCVGEGDDDRACIPGGPFIFGASNVVYMRGLDPTPQRLVLLSRFAIDRDEVTVGKYRAALASGMPPPRVPPSSNPGELGTDTSPQSVESCTWSHTPVGREEHPLNCVSLETARAYCKFRGGTLPSEAQWEYVATQAGRQRKTAFPWGDEQPSCDRAVYSRVPGDQNEARCEPLGRGPRPVTEYTDVTPLGVRGLGGGLTEWTTDSAVSLGDACWEQDAPRLDPSCTEPSSAGIVVRGGAWGGDASYLRSTLRFNAGQERRSGILGFRCVYPEQEVQ